MANYILSKKAQEDLRKIWYYTVDTWSEKQADIYFHSLIQSLDSIAVDPNSVGRSYEEVRVGYRGLHSGRHIIFYRISTVLKTSPYRVFGETQSCVCQITGMLNSDL